MTWIMNYHLSQKISKRLLLLLFVKRLLYEKKTTTPDELAKEYADSVEENKSIMKDFKNADLENWDDY